VLAEINLRSYTTVIMRGHVDILTAEAIAGWALDDELPYRSVDVSIFVDGRKLAQVTCDLLRKFAATSIWRS
jgi:hypothetical protein